MRGTSGNNLKSILRFLRRTLVLRSILLFIYNTLAIFASGTFHSNPSDTVNQIPRFLLRSFTLVSFRSTGDAIV